MSQVGEEINDLDLFGSDFKMQEIATEKTDLMVDRNGDIAVVEGQDYILQRIKHVLLTRARFYPPQIPEIIALDEILKANMDENGRHYYPGDLEELGYPEYGSILGFLINENRTSVLITLIKLYTTNAISLEYENGVAEISDLKVQEEEDGYTIILSIRLISNKTVEISQVIGET
jgi:hypothetical protein